MAIGINKLGQGDGPEGATDRLVGDVFPLPETEPATEGSLCLMGGALVWHCWALGSGHAV